MIEGATELFDRSSYLLRVNITIVYEPTDCATSAFSISMLCVVLTSFCFDFSNDVASCRILFCLFLQNLFLKRVYILFIFIFKRRSVAIDKPQFVYMLIIRENGYFAVDDVA